MAEISNGELSEREREVLRLVATGAGNKEIAQKLVISPNTVKVHLRNIFAKVGVASRTEATLYAIRHGIVKLDEASKLVSAETLTADEGLASPAPAALPFPLAAPALQAPPPRRLYWLALLGGMALIAIAVSAVAITRQSPTVTLPAPTAAVVVSQWQTKASLPTPRSGFASVAYENQIYVIGGEGAHGLLTQTERYDPAQDAWTTLAPLPLAVADVSAVVIGGQIYVPGGRLASGQVTNTLAVYNPRADRWEQRAPLPVTVSAYALVAYEGNLFLFGGWDGKKYLASVFAYDPNRDEWMEKSPLPTARGFAGAAVASGRIYVIGGTAGQQALAVNEAYTPEAEGSGNPPWQTRAALPEGRAQMGITAIADIVQIVGGEGTTTTTTPLLSLEYFSQTDQWRTFDAPGEVNWSGLGLVAVETRLHLLGGKIGAAPSNQHLTYQIVFTISLPVIR